MVLRPNCALYNIIKIIFFTCFKIYTYSFYFVSTFLHGHHFVSNTFGIVKQVFSNPSYKISPVGIWEDVLLKFSARQVSWIVGTRIFEVWEEMVVTGCQIRTIRWRIWNLHLNFLILLLYMGKREQLSHNKRTKSSCFGSEKQVPWFAFFYH